jgi:hypothetical protein
MLTLHRAVLAVGLAALPAASAFAQSETELKDFFEGKSVRVKIDMPATQQGIDVFPDARRPMDLTQYSARLKSFGVAVHNGDAVMVTMVRVKDKVIEFQLAGGGYGTFGDDTSTSVYVPTVPKTQREKDLEKQVKQETNPDRKRRLQRELDDLRSEREREDARNRARSASASEVKRERIATDRLHSGSRFNLRYQDGVPPGLAPDGVMRALEEYVDFSSLTNRPVRQGRPIPREPVAPPATDIRKGMTMADVESALGRPDKTTPRTEGTLRVVVATYTRGDQVVTAEFVEGVLIKYSISSK